MKKIVKLIIVILFISSCLGTGDDNVGNESNDTCYNSYTEYDSLGNKIATFKDTCDGLVRIIVYYPNGNIMKSKFQDSNDNNVGVYISYHENGNIKCKYSYGSDENITGVYRLFHTSGNIEQYRYYDEYGTFTYVRYYDSLGGFLKEGGPALMTYVPDSMDNFNINQQMEFYNDIALPPHCEGSFSLFVMDSSIKLIEQINCEVTEYYFRNISEVQVTFDTVGVHHLKFELLLRDTIRDVTDTFGGVRRVNITTTD
ncbi:MAG: hypothetical protein KAG64_01880 [Bacteroidales bacterium]|nr:hypothetical protein [Bacteroidales bacterium]